MQAIVKVTNELQLQEVPKPVPGDHEVLVKAHAATITADDVMLNKLPLLLWLPMRLLLGHKRKTTHGHEFAGVVEAVGQYVTQFKPGAAVFGTTTGLNVGANAEYVCVPETWESGVLAHKPANMLFEEAAAVPVGGLTALHYLRQANIQRSQRVLIYGASGSVGTFAVQLARYLGAEVTGVCSTRHVELVKSLGAAHVVDYTQENFAGEGAVYDAIFDAVGKSASADVQQALKPGGAFVTVRKGLAKEQTANLLFLKDLIEAGALRSVIDRRYPLAQTTEAYQYVESGRKTGNVVITVGHHTA